jgi:hypothetical protein
MHNYRFALPTTGEGWGVGCGVFFPTKLLFYWLFLGKLSLFAFKNKIFATFSWWFREKCVILQRFQVLSMCAAENTRHIYNK